MIVVYPLYGIAVLALLFPLALVFGSTRYATTFLYSATLVISLVLAVLAIANLTHGPQASTLVLPLGLPWLGAHFRIDALSAFFLFVINLGGAAASMFALGYGQHEEDPQRVLPFYAAYLAGMNLVVLADDAFTFLVSWEFMSLSSWALVIANHREQENVRAGYVYLLMAGFGTLALLFAFGLLAGPDGGYAFEQIRSEHPTTGIAALILVLALVGTGSKAACSGKLGQVIRSL